MISIWILVVIGRYCDGDNDDNIGRYYGGDDIDIDNNVMMMMMMILSLMQEKVQ